jgi:uncharacterized damage-inducible protein DinB
MNATLGFSRQLARHGERYNHGGGNEMTIEVWLSGPVEGIDPLLQPVAHALLQVRNDTEALCSELDEVILWKREGNAAPIGFHLSHIAGATDRLFTYARGGELNEEQIAAMKAEKTVEERKPQKQQLLDSLRETFDRALAQLRNTGRDDLVNAREVGRAKLPSTVLGLLFHAAEHAQRHSGQIATTARFLSAK